MITKFGIVGVGVLAGLAAVAPLASASESHGDHHGHGGHGGHASSTCSVAGGEAGAANTINGDALANVVAQAPIGGANVLNLTCNEILNDNLNGNSLAVSILGTELPGLPF
ncbi:hypothetical protein [Actinomycetospora sp. CA-084318]|uniref:hypothetical protein n=1 Tax=Actinomycetospora sp. CA-084318 TaxID=3239892 RepID=UPI003D98F61C